jgi:hypothetical protein
MANYSIYPGKFLCKTCKKEVKTMRVYLDTGMASWMCNEKHLSEIMLFKKGYKKVKQDD